MPTPAFVDKIAADPSEAQKLRSLGAETPEALLAMISASPDAFENFVGRAAARNVISRLRGVVPNGGAGFDAPAPPPGRLGVPLGGVAPSPLSAPYDISQRDRMFDELKRLRASHAPADEIGRAEHALDDLLSGRG